MMHIVLVHPEIPQNTGNIARTCAATGAMLHLIEPLGFELSDKYLKRAGLDYWRLMKLEVHESWAAFRAAYPEANFWFTSTKSPRDYAGVRYADGFFLYLAARQRACPKRCFQSITTAVSEFRCGRKRGR